MALEKKRTRYHQKTLMQKCTKNQGIQPTPRGLPALYLTRMQHYGHHDVSYITQTERAERS